MITLPSAFTSGYAAKRPVTFFIDVQVVSGSTPMHLYITNQPSVTFTYGGVTLSASGSVQSSYLGAYINNSGNEEQVQGIGEIDFTIDAVQGGSLASLNTLSLLFLNQGSFVHSHSYDFENQTVKVFKSFIATNGSCTVETDMVAMFSGVITRAYTYDPVRFQIECVDRRQVDAKMMPRFFLNETNTPHADQAAMNKFVPTLIGDFQTPNTTERNTSPTPIGSKYTTDPAGFPPLYPFVFGDLSAAPTVIADIYSGQALVSDVQFSLSGSVFITDDSTKYISLIPAGAVAASGSSSGRPGWQSGSGAVGSGSGSTNAPLIPAGVVTSLIVQPTYGEIWIKPSVQGYHPDVFYPPYGPGRTRDFWEQSPYAVPSTTYRTEIGNAVDGDIDSFVEVTDIDQPVQNFLQVQLPSFTPPGSLINRQDPLYAYPESGIDFYFGGIFEFLGGAIGGVGGDFVYVGFDSQQVVSGTDVVRRFDVSASGVFGQEWAVRADNLKNAGNPRFSFLTWDLMKQIYFGIGTNQNGAGTKKLRIHQLWIRARTRFENTGIVKTAVAVPEFANFKEIRAKVWATNQTLVVPERKNVQSGGHMEVRGLGISNLFVPAKGPTFRSDMVSGSSSSHNNGHTTADLIDDPASAVEYLLLAKMDVPTSAIDAASFDVLNNTTNGLRKSWKCAASLIERKSVLDYVAQLCQEYHMSMFITSAGKYRLVAHDTVASPVYNIGASDIYFDGYPQIAITTTNNDAIFNDITLNYQFDYTRSKNISSIYVSDINFSGSLSTNLISNSGALRDTSYTGWMQDSIDRYKSNRQAKFDAMFIQDQATAELSIKKFCDWLAFERLKVTVKVVPNMSIVALEPGDVIKITSSYLTSIFSNTAQFLIVSVRVPAVGTTTTPYLTIECLELPSANTGTPILTNRFISSDDLVGGT